MVTSMSMKHALVLVLMTSAVWRNTLGFLASGNSNFCRTSGRGGFFPNYHSDADTICKSQRGPTRPNQAIRALSFPPMSTLLTRLSFEDEGYLREAIEYAKLGLGHTFPNPAVGCVIVMTTTSSSSSETERTTKVIGTGFHPRAGYPHAEVFALLEASGHVPNGVDAAQTVVNGVQESAVVDSSVEQLTRQYIDQGPQSLFADCLKHLTEESDSTVTAYVTLEPCCHSGKTTPPCASTLAVAGVDRVVVGFRDPNPRVDGGGVQFLREEASIVVNLAEGALEQQCAKLITNFCKRITPPLPSYELMTGAMRSSLRTLAAQMKQRKSLNEVSWGGASVQTDDDSDVSMEDLVDQLVLEPEWMEHLDDILWRDELVLLRLNQAVAKRRYVRRLGDRIASMLQAHVAQSVGHTVLLYRPGKPPNLNLQQLVEDRNAVKSQ